MPAIAIIGASRGIGREFVDQYLNEGWTVFATARAAADRDALQQAGANAFVADVTDEASLRALAEAAPELDVVIVNAGVSAQRYERSIADIDAEDWTRVMRINSLGPVLAARALAPRIRKPGGKFLILSSVMGSVGENEGGDAWSYRMSKAAVNMAVRNLALMFAADGVSVAALHPGWVKTDMGGPSAPVAPTESVAGMREVIAALGPDDRRQFIDYSNREIAW